MTLDDCIEILNFYGLIKNESTNDCDYYDKTDNPNYSFIAVYPIAEVLQLVRQGYRTTDYRIHHMTTEELQSVIEKYLNL